MIGQILVLAGAVVLGGLTISVLVLIGTRARVPLAVDLLRRFSRLFNPRNMRTAGTAGDERSIVRHRGRRSGRELATPVGAAATEDGFVIALPYGMRAQWVRNVLASGSATIVSDGHEHAVDQPELIPLESVADRFSAGDQRGFRMFAVEQALRVRRVAAPGAA